MKAASLKKLRQFPSTNPSAFERLNLTVSKCPEKTLYKPKIREGITRKTRGQKLMLRKHAENVVVNMMIAKENRGILITERNLVEDLRVMLKRMLSAQRHILKNHACRPL